MDESAHKVNGTASVSRGALVRGEGRLTTGRHAATTSVVHGASALHVVGVGTGIVRLIIVILSPKSSRVLHKFAQGLVAFSPLDLAFFVGE